jgi:hypothetical protein
MIVPILLFGLGMLSAYVGSHRLSLFQFTVVFLVFATGATFVVAPDLANRTANALNVGTGANLLLYFAVLAGIFVAANFYFRFKQLEQVLTNIVRELAILTPQSPATKKENA